MKFIEQSQTNTVSEYEQKLKEQQSKIEQSINEAQEVYFSIDFNLEYFCRLYYYLY